MTTPNTESDWADKLIDKFWSLTDGFKNREEARTLILQKLVEAKWDELDGIFHPLHIDPNDVIHRMDELQTELSTLKKELKQ